jgi:hypothetical protein
MISVKTASITVNRPGCLCFDGDLAIAKICVKGDSPIFAGAKNWDSPPDIRGDRIVTAYIRALVIGASALAVTGILWGNAAGQSSGRAAFAAKQRIKEQVVAAMADGQITQDERRDILLGAKSSLTAEEYFGLAQTMNRLSPTDRPTRENLGYAPYVDKQYMASFPAPDLSWMAKSSVGKAISQQSLAKSLAPNQFAPKETVVNQGYVVRETITKQTIVKETVPNNQAIAKQSGAKQPVAKTTVARQVVVKQAPPKASVATTSKADAAARVILLPPPPRDTSDKQSKSAPAVKTQNQTAEAKLPLPPMPPVARSPARSAAAAANKTALQKPAETPKKLVAASNQLTLEQPEEVLRRAEKSSYKSSYADYSVPVLNTPAAALLSEGNHAAIQASFNETFEPELRQGIIRR